MQYRLTTLSDSACAVGQDLAVDARDPLSYPLSADLLGPALSLLPTGAAWGTPDGEAPPRESVRARLWQAFCIPLADFLSAAFTVALEAKATSLATSIEDWEAEYGLPDPCATGSVTPASVPPGAWYPLLDEDGFVILDEAGEPILADDVDLWMRKEAIKRKVRATAIQRPADFVCLAWSMGYEADVVEVSAFRCGESSCGENELTTDAADWCWFIRIRPRDTSIYFHCGSSECGVDELIDPMVGLATFECGVSECGVDPLLHHDPPWSDIEHFEAGVGQCGVTPLSFFPFAEDLQCFAGKIKPAESVLHFRFSLLD